MAVEVVFYSLAPKPAASGDKTYAAAAAGKVARGRKWFRLECRPEDVYQFPDKSGSWDAGASAVYEWLGNNPDAMRNYVAFQLGGEFYAIDNDAALSAIHGGAAARDNAIALQLKGKPGWVVFIPEEEDADVISWRPV